MRPAIVLAVILMAAPRPLHAQELGVSVIGGYSIPGESRIFSGLCSVSEGERPYAQMTFNRKQAGPVVGGDLFLRIEPVDMGIGTVMFSKGGISGQLLSTIARRDEVNARDFSRSFRSAFVFLRFRAIGDSPVKPYLGAGVGIYGLREHDSREYSDWEIGGSLQLVAGGEARLDQGFTRPFAEMRVNFAGTEADDDSEPGVVNFATFTVAIGLRFAH